MVRDTGEEEKEEEMEQTDRWQLTNVSWKGREVRNGGGGGSGWCRSPNNVGLMKCYIFADLSVTNYCIKDITTRSELQCLVLLYIKDSYVSCVCSLVCVC